MFGSEEKKPVFYDRQLLFLTISLICIGFIMVFSASVMQAESKYGSKFFFVWRDILAIAFAGCAGICALSLSGDFYRKSGPSLLLLGLLGLVLVLCVGSRINSAKRWINLGFMNIQPAEFMKLFWVIFLADFLARKHGEMKKVRSFVKLGALLALAGMLLLLQPDFGTLSVLSALFMGMLFIGGSNLFIYGMVVAAIVTILGLFALLEPYRLLRMTTFLDPWNDPFGKGYQLTQSLMAFGRGGFWGEGLGNSVQKMEYLPEAHTDFVFAILAEELGYAGVIAVVLLEGWLVLRLLVISRRMLLREDMFSGFLTFGVSLWIATQTVINIGAASGMLPTKGLTLPFVSYGGSSIAVFSIALAIVLRVDYEYRKAEWLSAHSSVAPEIGGRTKTRKNNAEAMQGKADARGNQDNDAAAKETGTSTSRKAKAAQDRGQKVIDSEDAQERGAISGEQQ